LLSLDVTPHLQGERFASRARVSARVFSLMDGNMLYTLRNRIQQHNKSYARVPGTLNAQLAFFSTCKVR
jgi:hypothetical protein